MSEFFSNFFLDETEQLDKLNLFGFNHLFLLFLTAAAGVALYLFRNRLRQWKHKEKLRYIMAAVFFVNMLFLYLYYILRGVYDWKLHLPLHLCFISGYLFMYVLVTGNKKLFEAVYFFTWIGPLPAMLWPNTPTRLDRFLFHQFFISHHLLLLMGLYCLFVLEYRIGLKSMGKAFLLGNGIFLAIYLFNLICGTNYIMTDTLPPHILSMFPFLQYFNIPILWLELCGAVMMLLAYLPAKLVNVSDAKRVMVPAELQTQKA